MTIPNEIQEIILNAGQKILEDTPGPLSDAGRTRLISNLRVRTPMYTGRHPIPDLLNDLHAATVVPYKALKDGQTGPPIPTQGDGKWPPAPITDQWAQAIRKSAETATGEHFRQAEICFDQARPQEATEHLCSGIICSIAAIAAQQGWPHQDRKDLTDAVIALSTGGELPQEGDSIYDLLQSASEQGQDLNSAFSAAMGQPNAVRTGLFYDSTNGCDDDAMFFAKRTVELARQLAGEPR